MNVGRDFDLLVVGGGINGTGIARDAAGRGLRVLLIEQAGLAHHTSSASSKLIHGGLRYLEHFELRLVREALKERERLLRIAPHLVARARFVLPHHAQQRPSWMLRAGLLAYDLLAPGSSVGRSRSIRLASSPLGAPLRSGIARGFSYGDCTVDDSRLVILNAKDAAERSAQIRIGHRLLSAARHEGQWQAHIEQVASGERYAVSARIIVNAAGPWVAEVLHQRIGVRSGPGVRLVKGSHIVVPRLYTGDQAYVLQNPDRRIVFVIPYQGEYTLIGTTDIDWSEAAGRASITPQETDYLCETVNRYFRQPITPQHVVWSYAGLRPLIDSPDAAASELTRDYSLELDAPAGAAPVLSVFGGKITTYRPLAERVLARLAAYLPGLAPPWTADTPLPGGDFGPAGLRAYSESAWHRWPFLWPQELRRLVHAYGTRLERVLESVKSRTGLGQSFGGGLTQREVDYLLREEWASSSEDLYWRHTKTGLAASAADRKRLNEYLAGLGHRHTVESAASADAPNFPAGAYRVAEASAREPLMRPSGTG
ncbi:MAG: glycerol-3-phosphate dehydrogenase [Steroidobacteraceae bacterium]